MDILSDFKKAANIDNTFRNTGYYTKDYKIYRECFNCYNILKLSLFYLSNSILSLLTLLIFFNNDNIIFFILATFSFLMMISGSVGLFMFFKEKKKLNMHNVIKDLFFSKNGSKKIDLINQKENEFKKINKKYKKLFSSEHNLKIIYNKKEKLTDIEYEFFKQCFYKLPKDDIEIRMAKTFNKNEITNL